jgi:hypothetical protein
MVDIKKIQTSELRYRRLFEAAKCRATLMSHYAKPPDMLDDHGDSQ